MKPLSLCLVRALHRHRVPQVESLVHNESTVAAQFWTLFIAADHQSLS